MTTNNNKSGNNANSQQDAGDVRLVEAIQAWMVLRLAEELKLKPVDIDPGLPFISYGLDSIVAFTLTGELADLIGRELPTTLFWDFPRIEALAFHLADEIKDGEVAAYLLAEIGSVLSRLDELVKDEIIDSEK